MCLSCLTLHRALGWGLGHPVPLCCAWPRAPGWEEGTVVTGGRSFQWEGRPRGSWLSESWECHPTAGVHVPSVPGLGVHGSHRRLQAGTVTWVRHVTWSGHRFPAWALSPLPVPNHGSAAGKGGAGAGGGETLFRPHWPACWASSSRGRVWLPGATATVSGAWGGDSWECRSRASTALAS